VAGDIVYGHRKAQLGLARQFLHASYLGFELPDEERCLVAWAPLPPELGMILESLRGERSSRSA
jgi:23S rRNA-/tRNA-specific pseudouridylate synthase